MIDLNSEGRNPTITKKESQDWKKESPHCDKHTINHHELLLASMCSLHMLFTIE